MVDTVGVVWLWARLIGGVEAPVYPASFGAGVERCPCAEAARRGMSGFAAPLRAGSLRLAVEDMMTGGYSESLRVRSIAPAR